jgi:hypothetical protein
MSTEKAGQLVFHHNFVTWPPIIIVFVAFKPKIVSRSDGSGFVLIDLRYVTLCGVCFRAPILVSKQQQITMLHIW